MLQAKSALPRHDSPGQPASALYWEREQQQHAAAGRRAAVQRAVRVRLLRARPPRQLPL